jgi:hypothetical protein
LVTWDRLQGAVRRDVLLYLLHRQLLSVLCVDKLLGGLLDRLSLGQLRQAVGVSFEEVLLNCAARGDIPAVDQLERFLVEGKLLGASAKVCMELLLAQRFFLDGQKWSAFALREIDFWVRCATK